MHDFFLISFCLLTPSCSSGPPASPRSTATWASLASEAQARVSRSGNRATDRRDSFDHGDLARRDSVGSLGSSVGSFESDYTDRIETVGENDIEQLSSDEEVRNHSFSSLRALSF